FSELRRVALRHVFLRLGREAEAGLVAQHLPHGRQHGALDERHRTSFGARRSVVQVPMCSGDVESAAVPLTRSVSSTPGIRKSRPTLPVATMFSSESRRLFPGASGISRSPPSLTFTNPGSPPRGEASMLWSRSEVATTRNGESAMKLG